MEKMYIDKNTFEVIGDLEDTRISGPLFECDELIAPTISLLNRLGFTTAFCCSGHAYEVKEPGQLHSYWRDSNCYICFTKSLKEMAKSGFTVPEGFETNTADDYFEFHEDHTWEFMIYKDFEHGESQFLQVLDNAKALYGWACAMAYARDKEFEATKKKMSEIYVEIPSFDWKNKSDHPVINEKYATIIKWKNCHNADEYARVQDYYDFIKDLRTLFYEATGKPISSNYKKLKSPYEHTRMKYILPPMMQCSFDIGVIMLIADSLERIYGDLYDQYNDPCGSDTIGSIYYEDLDNLIKSVEVYVEKNY